MDNWSSTIGIHTSKDNLDSGKKKRATSDVVLPFPPFYFPTASGLPSSSHMLTVMLDFPLGLKKMNSVM